MRSALLRWYDREGRDLPWREVSDPYAIWVSEVMLQQTRVDKVVPYWKRFMRAFPTPTALASAHEDEVLSHWSGLGYYRRARLLHRGAREVVARYGGRVPEDADARRSLPGVGRYTAGAIGSIAFGREEPVVDGNVARVIARYRGIETPLDRSETARALWDHAGRLVRGARPGDFNQALMELGARVCVPRNPDCERCPIRRGCVARREDRVDSLPTKKAKRAPRRVALSAVVTERAGQLVLVKREGALFGGLFAPPMHDGPLREHARSALRSHGIVARLEPRSRARIEHVLSHRRLDVAVWSARAARFDPSAQLRAFADDELGAVGISTLTRKILAAVYKTERFA